tara:strand:- start:111 stop:479 length:369 start_codon:yes stop_codon:yes gene_type:complete
MKAKELRLGNYVNNEQRTEVIDGIDPYRVQCHLLSDKTRETLYEVPLQFIKPILLTEDWLLKFGFKVEKENKYLTYILGNITTYNQDNVWWVDLYWDYLELKYVHQLQNLYFALTNKELTIK